MNKIIVSGLCVVLIFSCEPSPPLVFEDKLPDPFLLESGARVESVDEWEVRRSEIAALSQQHELGEKPSTAVVSAQFNSAQDGNILTVTVSEGEESVAFECSISYPSQGSAPYPAMIGMGYSFLNNSQLSSLGIAVISFPNDTVAAQVNAGSRGQGLFYDLYGSDHSAGALMAWAWGVSCLIDALEQTPSANIDADHLGVTGCSRNGKGALIAGAFDERIQLTIPQESGSGGAASWRVSDFQKLKGQNVQTLSQSTWVCANAARLIYQAFGAAEHMGFSQIGGHDHCGLPQSQEPEVGSFVRRFLLGDASANTHVMKTDGGFSFSAGDWTEWAVPEL
ncbi:MAG: hypothetical protein JXB03_02080 [Spirochaetales bacterium]|nr:hypothetical protein [Spirochaetales bacterium]